MDCWDFELWHEAHGCRREQSRRPQKSFAPLIESSNTKFQSGLECTESVFLVQVQEEGQAPAAAGLAVVVVVAAFYTQPCAAGRMAVEPGH